MAQGPYRTNEQKKNIDSEVCLIFKYLKQCILIGPCAVKQNKKQKTQFYQPNTETSTGLAGDPHFSLILLDIGREQIQ